MSDKARLLAVRWGLLAFTYCLSPAMSWSQALEMDPGLTTAGAVTVKTVKTPSRASAAPFKLEARQSNFLPPAMYGQWSVTATLISADFDAGLSPVAHDIWLLERDGDSVTLTNPATGATASVSVDLVQGDTATFHHTVALSGGRRYLLERPTVTVSGDRLYGETVHEYTIFQRFGGGAPRMYHARFRIEAERLAPARAQWPQNPVAPTFEIEDIQPAPPAPARKPATQDSRLYVR
ncbi:MAG: hypothetical protein IPK79_06960 [Vampirovibrionales bacterium]|nr:hypothetical protein [Vampirovibrionales bacterium]